MSTFNSLSAAKEAAKYGIFDPNIIPATRNDNKLTVNDVKIFATLNHLPKIVGGPVYRAPSPRRAPVRIVPSPRKAPSPRRAPVRPVAPVRQKITPAPKTTSQKRLSKKALRQYTYKFNEECSVSMYDSESKYLPDPIIGNDYYNLLLDPFNNEKRVIVYNKLVAYNLYPELQYRLEVPCAGKIDFDSFTH